MLRTSRKGTQSGCNNCGSHQGHIAKDAIKIVAPAVIAVYVSYRTVKWQFAIERIRLNEKDKVDVHKKLLKFARELCNDTFQLAEDKKFAFINLMSSHYLGKLESDYVYFSDEATKILDTLENRYLCMTRGELIPEMNIEDEGEFVERQLFQLADQLRKYVKKTMSAREVNA